MTKKPKKQVQIVHVERIGVSKKFADAMARELAKQVLKNRKGK